MPQEYAGKRYPGRERASGVTAELFFPGDGARGDEMARLSESRASSLPLGLGSVKSPVLNNIKNEISAALFVAVEVDETTDVTNQAQISVTLCYVTKMEADCEVEVFLGFDDVSEDRCASAITEYVLGLLEK